MNVTQLFLEIIVTGSVFYTAYCLLRKAMRRFESVPLPADAEYNSEYFDAWGESKEAPCVHCNTIIPTPFMVVRRSGFFCVPCAKETRDKGFF